MNTILVVFGGIKAVPWIADAVIAFKPSKVEEFS